jgi:hypothetical protein
MIQPILKEKLRAVKYCQSQMNEQENREEENPFGG